MKSLLVFFIIILPFGCVQGQNDFFDEVLQMDLSTQSDKLSFVYFHFKGCAACMRMDKEVFVLDEVKDFLDSNFVCLQVFGLDRLQSRIRDKYKIKGDPTILFLNNEGEEVHRIVGFVNPEKLLVECKKSYTSNSLIKLDSIYNSGHYGIQFMSKYIETKELANLLDSSLIFEYFRLLPDSSLLQFEYLQDLMHYGYYKGIWELPIDSRYYHAINEAFNRNLFPSSSEDMRNRLILSLNFFLHRADEITTDSFNVLLNRLRSLEVGNPIVIRHLYSQGIYAWLEERYPSFEIEYKRARSSMNLLDATKIFKNHLHQNMNNARELNSLAWGVYEEKYDEDISLAFRAVLRAIELDPSYEYYDTYASLLYKNKDFIKAEEIANQAIELAKSHGKKYTETENLLISNYSP